MAEYINYGNLQIDLQQLLTNLADNVTSYVAAQPWSKKRKLKFMQYYTDMVNRGILGASNDTGLWMLDIGGTPYEEENMLKKDWQMLGEAAYFILLLMSRMPTRASLEKQEKLETKTPVFDNEYFLNLLGNHISINEFGGVKFDTQNDWNDLDKRNPETGLRDRTNRAQILARNLRSYADSLTDESKLNFEGSPFKNLADFKERINNAVHALTETPDTLNDDEESLRKLGLRYSDWFNNGSGDPVTVTLDDGTQRTTTYGLLADYNKKLNELKQLQILAKLKELEVAKLKQLAALRANWYDKYQNILTYNKITNDKLNGLPIPKEYYNNEINYLNELAKNPDLTNELRLQVIGAFNLFANKKALSNLTQEDIDKIGPLYRGIAHRFKKIDGVNGFYYDPIGKRIIHGFKNLTLTSLDVFNLNNLKQLQNNPRQINSVNDLQYEDYARIGAALGDVISLGGFGANIAGSIVSLFGDTTADIADDKVSTWEAIKNFGSNLGWTLAGFIPGAKLGKIGKNLFRWGPKLMVALNDYNLLNDESSKKTADKIVSGKMFDEGFNDEDLKNVMYWVRALTGNTNMVKATARDIKYSGARGTQGLEFTTKDGTKVILSNEAVLEINVAGAKRGLKAAEDKFKEKVKEVTGVEHEVADNTFNFTKNGRTGLFKNTRSKYLDLQLQGKSAVFRTSEQLRYYDLLKLDRNLGGLFGWRWLGSRGTSSYFDHFDRGFSFRNPLRGIGLILDPYRNISSTPQGNNPNRNVTPQGNNNPSGAISLDNSPLKSNKNNPQEGEFLDIRHGVFTNDRKTVSDPYTRANLHNLKVQDKKNAKNANNGKFSDLFPEANSLTFKTPNGTDNITVTINDNTYTITKKSSDGALSSISGIDVDKLKGEMLKSLKASFTKDNKQLAIPPNIVKVIQGPAYGWLKQGGRIDRLKIQMYKNYIKK